MSKTYTRKFPDSGCELAPSCLDCPLPECADQEQRRSPNRVRDEEIRRLHTEGWTVMALAAKHDTTARNILRILRG